MYNTISAKIYKNKEGEARQAIEHKELREEKLENTQLLKWFNRVGAIMAIVAAVLFIAMVIAQVWMRFN